MGKPLLTVSAGDVILAIRAYKNLSGYSTWKSMHEKHKQYGYAHTINHNRKTHFANKFFEKPIERGVDVAVVPVYHKKVRPRLKKRFGSVKDPFDIVRVTP